MCRSVIELKKFTKYYQEVRGIDDVTFDVKEGEIFGFIGPNGAGKTTTIRLLLALIKPTAGNASIFGMDAGKKADVIASRTGYLPSDSFYYEKMKVKELLKYSADLYKVHDPQRLEDLVSRLDLDMNRRIADLSTGNKKKVGIVSALLHKPELLIMDEPTSGLDPLVQQTFFDILREENQKGATIFFSSHVLSDVQKIADRVGILKEGKLISIQNTKEMREVGYKKISVAAKDAIPKNYFGNNGVADYKEKGNEATFIFKGDIADIIERIHLLGVTDVEIKEPSLEEIFLHYYK